MQKVRRVIIASLIDGNFGLKINQAIIPVGIK
jgi:hypothetical protein